MTALLTTGKAPSNLVLDPQRPGWRWWRRLGSRLTHRIDYLVTTALATMIAQTWFEAKLHTATGDITPFVRDSLAASLPDVWGYQLTGAGSPSYEVARIFDVAVIKGVELLGMDAAIAQRVFYSALVVLTAVAGTYLAAAFTKRVGLRIAFGSWVVANPYWLVLIPNPIFLLAVAIGGLSAGFLVRAARGQPPRTTTVVLASTLLAPLSVNPPLLTVMVGWVLLLIVASTLMGGPGGFRRSLVFSVKVLPWALAINLFWIVPAVIVIATGSTVVAAQVSAEAWSWSHAQNTIPNVVGLNAHWGWAFPDTYYPYAPRLDSPWFNWMRFAVPFLAAMAPVLARGRRRRIAVAMLGFGAIAAFVGKGFHPPLADANRWLYEQIPGMWLLREPMSKVGWIMVLAYLIAAVIAADRLLELGARHKRWRMPLVLAPVVGIVAALIYVHPLWTGEAIPADRGRLGGSHVAIPEAWYETANVVNELDDTGTVLMLPIPGFYQMGHTWGYYGADEMAAQLITRRTIQPSDGGYYTDPPVYRASSELLESALSKRDQVTAARLLDTLGVSTVVVRHDYDPEISQGEFANPDDLEVGLQSLDEAELVLSTPVASVWQMASTRSRVSATTNLVEFQPSASAEATARALAATRNGFALVPTGLLPANDEESAAWVVDSTVREIVLDEAADLIVSVTPTATASWVLTPSGDGLEIAAVERLMIDGTPAFWQDPIHQPTDGLPEAVSIGDRIIPLDGPTTAAIDTSQTIVVYTGDGRTKLEAPVDDQVGDCNAYDDRTPIEAGLDVVLFTDGVRISAESHSACARYSLPSGFDKLLRVTVDAYSVSGSPPRMCVYSTTEDGCIAKDVLNTRSGELSALVPAKPGLELYVYADEPVPDSDASYTTTEYRRPRVEILDAAGAVYVPELPRRITLSTLSEGAHTISAGPASTTPIPLSDFSQLGDCHRHDDRSIEEAGLAFSEPVAGTIRLQASAHSACASIGLGPIQFTTVTVSLEYRTISGSSPRICMWQVGPNACAELPPLPQETDWQQLSATTTLDLTADDVRLYLYADAPPGNLDYDTVVEYRNVAVFPAAPWTAVVTTEPNPNDTVPVQVISSRDRAAIHFPAVTPDGPLLLILNDTFDESWTLSGAKGGRHVPVDGWANGWIFDDASDLAGANVVVSYRPARWAASAAAASGVVLVAVILTHLVGSIRTKLRKRSYLDEEAHLA